MPLPMISRACPTCKVEYALPVAFYEGAKLTHAVWFCPNGHKLCFAPRKPQDGPKLPPEVQALERECTALRARVAALEADCDCAFELAMTESETRQRLQHRLSSAKLRARMLRRENKGGTCPWCHQQFDNLRRHLAAKHQGFIEAQKNIA